MSYVQKPLTGSLFKNEKKAQPSHPDYTGSMLDENGDEFWMDAWIKRPEGKKTFMSFSFKRKQQQRSQQPQGERPPSRPPAHKPTTPPPPAAGTYDGNADDF